VRFRIVPVAGNFIGIAGGNLSAETSSTVGVPLGYGTNQISNDIGMARQMVVHYMRFKDQMVVALEGPEAFDRELGFANALGNGGLAWVPSG